MMALIRELPGVTEVTEQDCREDGCHLLLIRHEMDADLRAQVSALCYEITVRCWKRQTAATRWRMLSCTSSPGRTSAERRWSECAPYSAMN